jgi:hypothetical protein
LKCAHTTVELDVILNLFLQQLVSDTILPAKFTFHGRVLNSVARVALVRKAGNEIKTRYFSKPLGVKKKKRWW